MNSKASINLIFFFLFTLLFTNSTLAQESNPEPVLHFAFENSVIDSTGLNKSIAVDGGNFVEDRQGNANSAFYFDGEDDAITIEDTDSPLDEINNETGMTFMTWIKFEGFDDESFTGRIFERYDSYSDEGYYFGINRDGGIELPGSTYSSSIPRNEWTHIAIVIYEGVCSVYVNGRFSEKASFNLDQASNSEITLGLSRFSNRPYNGAIDDLKIYNQPVSENEIRVTAGLEPIPDYSNSKILDLSFNQNLVDSSIAANEVIGSKGGYTEGRFGDRDYAYSFMEDDSYIDLKFEEPESAFSKIEDFTITAWIKINSFNNTESVIIQKPSITESKSKGFKYYIDWRGTLDLEAFSAVSTTFGSARVLPQNEWIHIATSVDGHEVKNYVNGELKEARTISRSTGIDFQNTKSINIGNDENGEKPFNGSIDELEVFNYALTQEEIAEQIDYEYITPIPEPRMLLYLPFDSESGNEVILPGEYEESGVVKAKDRFGEDDGAIYLASDTSQIMIKNTNTSLDSLYRNISLSAWIRIDEFSYRPTIISRSDSTFGDGFRLALEEKDAGGGHTLYFSLNGISIEKRDFSIQKGTWVHVAGTYDGEFAKIFVNGKLIAEESVDTKLSIQDPNIYIGQNVERGVRGAISRGSFFGKIDDVRIHNYAISSDSISAYYENRFRGYSTEPKSVLSLAFDGSIVDSSTVSNTIENIGATFVEDRFGDSESAISFDGEDDMLVIKDTNNALDSISTGLTISTWAKMEREYSGSHPGETLVERNDGDFNHQYSIGIEDYKYTTEYYNDVEQVFFTLGGEKLTFRDAPVQAGEWFHVAGTFDGEEMKLYLNGRLAKAQPYEITVNIRDTNLYIGNNSKESQPFSGSLDDTQLYNYALTDSAIANLYEDRPEDQNLDQEILLKLSFENSLEDSSYARHQVIDHGGSFTRDRFRIERSAYSLNGIDDAIIVKDTDTALDSISSKLTITAWVDMYRHGEFIEDLPTYNLISRESTEGKGYSLTIREGINESGNNDIRAETAVFRIGNTELTYTDRTIQTESFENWVHIAAAYNGSEMMLYVNGELVGSKQYDGAIQASEYDIYIGNNAEGTQPFYGNVDEIQIFNKVLSESSIAAMVDINTFTVSKEPEPELPSRIELARNYPNPFNPTTQIEFSLPATGNVTLKVFNTIGHEVALLEEGRLSAGTHSATFDASGLSSGVYFYQLTFDGKVTTKKMLLIK